MVAVPLSSLSPMPMLFWATATPIDAPTPLLPPKPTANDAATTVAWIAEVLAALTFILPATVTVDRSTIASVCVCTLLIATAPAPLSATPDWPPTPMPTEAATDTALMLLWETSSFDASAADNFSV